MFWMDQLIYNSEQNMPFVKQEMDNGIYFENAFTLFCNTYPTFRYLFTDVTENTIELFSRKNVMTKKSKVCELLSRYNYDFKVISSEFNHMNIKRAYCSGGCVEPYISISALLWKVFMSLLDSQKACFMVMHELIQTHGPIMTSEMNYEMLQNNNNAPKLRKVKALNDINEQIKFYVSMLNEKATRIYMSDHGTGDEVCQQMRCMFAITGESYVPQRVKEMFSYKNFYLLLKQMLDKKIQLENITCKYAQIYGFPLYNRILIGNRIKRGECFISDFEFRGCVTEDNIYLLIQEDRELLLNRNQLPTMQYILPSKKDICNEEILPDFRDKIGTIYIDWKAEKWKYTMYYKRVYENWKNYNRNQITELNQYIRESGYSMIGIRMGGIHSAVLYECLDDDNQNRIIAFIDNNPNCECVKFKKKIITVYEMLYVEQEMVILSSFEKLEFLRHESSYYPKNIEIFDMYQFLQEKGYPNKAIYCDFKGMPEDGYKVNFPFEE